MIADKKSRNWGLILYDYPTIKDVRDRILELPHCKHFLGILHDKDFKENGQPDTPHYHVVLNLDNAYSFSYLQKFFCYEGSNVFAEDRNKYFDGRYGAYKYLLHLDELDKWQYLQEDLISDDLNYWLVKKSQVDQFDKNDFFIEMNYKFFNRNQFDSDSPSYMDMIHLFGRDWVKYYWTYQEMFHFVEKDYRTNKYCNLNLKGNSNK